MTQSQNNSDKAPSPKAQVTMKKINISRALNSLKYRNSHTSTIAKYILAKLAMEQDLIPNCDGEEYNAFIQELEKMLKWILIDMEKIEESTKELTDELCPENCI